MDNFCITNIDIDMNRYRFSLDILDTTESWL